MYYLVENVGKIFLKNLKSIPLNSKALKNRENFSRWMFRLHEQINKMLNKKSGLTYEQVRERYEHFRARCTEQVDTKLVIMKRRRRKTRKNVILVKKVVLNHYLEKNQSV